MYERRLFSADFPLAYRLEEIRKGGGDASEVEEGEEVLAGCSGKVRNGGGDEEEDEEMEDNDGGNGDDESVGEEDRINFGGDSDAEDEADDLSYVPDYRLSGSEDESDDDVETEYESSTHSSGVSGLHDVLEYERLPNSGESDNAEAMNEEEYGLC